MNLTNLLRLGAPACVALVLAACGGSSENASPGSVIVEVPVGGDDDDENDDGDDDDSGSQDPVDETTVAPVIPSALEDVISNSGESAGAAFGNKPIYTIDVSETSALDPAGLVLGNDVIFEIAGGAARITAPDGAAVSSGGGLPECQLDMAPGAVIAGGSSTDFLIIEQGCALMADGTADQPIVFTARAEADGAAEDNDRGLWGGVINGYAPINDCPEGATGGTAECTKEGEANSGLFGGDDPTTRAEGSTTWWSSSRARTWTRRTS